MAKSWRRTRVLIEPIGVEHEPRIQVLASDAAIAATSHIPSPYPAGAARTWITHAEQARQLGLVYAFAVIDSSEGVVGVTSLIEVDRLQKTSGLGYWIGRPYWGRGYATESVRQVLGFGFRELELWLIRATCLAANAASVRVLKKVGFEPIGPGRTDSRGPTVEFILPRLAASLD